MLSTIREAAALQIIAHAFGLRVVEVPIGHIHRIEPRPIENRVVVGIDHFLVGPRVQARQAQNALHKLAVGARIIFGPAAIAKRAESAESAVAGHAHRIAQAGEGKLVLLLIVGRTAVTVALIAVALAGLRYRRHRQQTGARAREQHSQ